MKRSFDPERMELMDQPQPVSKELQVDLDNLRKLNAYFGSYRLIRFFLKHWLQPGRKYALLDLATGGGDIPRMIVDWARERDIAVTIDAVDAQPSTLEIARRLSEGYPEITFLRDDIRTFAPPCTYDFVCCSLALHHFSWDDAIRVLRRMRELSHDKVLAADLDRNVLTWISVYTVTTFAFREPMTRHDARLSVQRAFSFREFRELAKSAGWDEFGQARFLPARQAIWMNKREVEPIIDFGLPSSDLAPG